MVKSSFHLRYKENEVCKMCVECFKSLQLYFFSYFSFDSNLWMAEFHTWRDIQILLLCLNRSPTGFYTPRSSWTCRSNCHMSRRRRSQRSAGEKRKEKTQCWSSETFNNLTHTPKKKKKTHDVVIRNHTSLHTYMQYSAVFDGTSLAQIMSPCKQSKLQCETGESRMLCFSPSAVSQAGWCPPHPTPPHPPKSRLRNAHRLQIDAALSPGYTARDAPVAMVTVTTGWCGFFLWIFLW